MCAYWYAFIYLIQPCEAGFFHSYVRTYCTPCVRARVYTYFSDLGTSGRPRALGRAAGTPWERHVLHAAKGAAERAPGSSGSPPQRRPHEQEQSEQDLPGAKKKEVAGVFLFPGI